jgi:hypothetical protein
MPLPPCEKQHVQRGVGHSVWKHQNKYYQMHCRQEGCFAPCPCDDDSEIREWFREHMRRVHDTLLPARLNNRAFISRFGALITDGSEAWYTARSWEQPTDDTGSFQHAPIREASAPKLNINVPPGLNPNTTTMDYQYATKSWMCNVSKYRVIVVVVVLALLGFVVSFFFHVAQENVQLKVEHTERVRAAKLSLQRNPCCVALSDSDCPGFSQCQVWRATAQSTFATESALRILARLPELISWQTTMKLTMLAVGGFLIRFMLRFQA